MASAPGELWSLSQLQPEREAAEAEPEVGSEKGRRGYQEHNLMTEGLNRDGGIDQASWCCAAGTPYRARSHTTKPWPHG